jgi:flagellar basal body-associated protein FliL
MNYIIGLLIGTGAFFAALLYTLFKRKRKQNQSNEISLIRRKLLAAVAVLIAFPYHWKKMASANQSDAKAPATSNNEKQTKKNAGGMHTATDRKNKLQQLKQLRNGKR